MTTHILEWLESKIPTTLNAGEVVELQELSFITGGNTTIRVVWQFLTKLTMVLPYDQQLYSWVFIQMNRKSLPTQRYAHEFLYHPYS